MRVGRAAPARLYIRSDRVEYLALLCPVHISALPPLCLFHPPFRRPALATAARCSFLRSRFAVFLSRLEVAPCLCDTSAIECSAERENHYFPRLTGPLVTRPSSSLHTMRDFGKENRVSKRDILRSIKKLHR